LGASFMVRVNEDLLKRFIGVFIIVISLLVLLEDFLKFKARTSKISHKHHFLSILAGLFIGTYIGVIGGGGATIVIFLLILIYGLSFHNAVATQKAVTLPISIIATLVFMYQGIIDYSLGIPLFIVNIIGGWIGAELLFRFNSTLLKRILVPISVILAIRLMFF
ncbi:sulfite exporter TauE/SafE family protein, partial [Candidatus Woesearchaeota archaeon]|nr:sulfite exporter TauE/SafE family protein [Candidatus Woesearchaeota archaeon]